MGISKERQVPEQTKQPRDDSHDDADDHLPSIPRREVTEDMIQSEPKRLKKKYNEHNLEKDSGVGEQEIQEEEEAAPLTGKALIRAQVEARIEAALKSNKRRNTRRRKTGEDDLEMMADEEVSALRSEMIVAADEDEEANRYRQPATSKLRLLPRVVSTLQK